MKTRKMEALSISETSVNFYQTTRRNNPEDSHLHTSRRKNLKSQNYSGIRRENPKQYEDILEDCFQWADQRKLKRQIKCKRQECDVAEAVAVRAYSFCNLILIVVTNVMEHSSS
jgi:hypothetical protein